MAAWDNIPVGVSRKDAIKLSLKYYYGKPCKYGHGRIRRMAGGGCVGCAAIHVKDWRSRNSEQIAAYQKRYIDEHREQHRITQKRYRDANPEYRRRNAERHRKWRAENLEHLASYRRQWAADNTDKEATYTRNRRARRRNGGGKHSAAEIAEILVHQGGKCAYCKCKITRKNRTVDHIVASFNGGRNDRANLQILCRVCNSSKGTRDPLEFAKSRGMLV